MQGYLQHRKRCGECAKRSSEKALAAYKYQCSLGRKKVAKAKYRHKSDDPLLQLPTMALDPVLETRVS
ncbi:hypothetical protein E2C01_053277 [Portunus trituberculatus]|uniref:Uncharacterized protein n=1 Tax=Portunus trituberculatus TaxID=210409 RepID=A0A5B7GGN2_PORTR|nr:hypothetical protein [Portunus trituberculatus]